MNIHHLELFYYVARHGGISRAVAQIPYGVQQPAVSGQMLLLEQELGKRLFERKPFSLTREGQQLYDFVRPFFENIQPTAQRLKGTDEPLLRIGASELVLRDHLPSLLAPVRRKYPQMRLSFRSGFQEEMEAALHEQTVDLAITPIESVPSPPIRCLRLVRLPLVLLVPAGWNITDAAELWRTGTVEHTLISLPPTETLTRLFRKGLRGRKADWPIGMEASSLDLVTRYVANGYGIGLSVEAGEIVKHPAVRVLPLVGFPPIEIAAFWNGDMRPVVRDVVTAMHHYATATWPEWSACARLPWEPRARRRHHASPAQAKIVPAGKRSPKRSASTASNSA